MPRNIWTPAENFLRPFLEIPSDDDSNSEDYLASNDGNENSRGLTSDRINKFPTFTANQNTVDDGCAICIDGVEIRKLMIRLDCNHFYCSQCIRKWFEKNITCPLCRRVYEN